MSDSYAIKIDVDASAGKKQLDALASSAKEATNALAKIGQGVSGGGGFSALSSQLTQLSSGFDALKRSSGFGAVGSQVQQLSAGLSKLRAPSAATSNNLILFAKALSGFRTVAVPKTLGNDLASLGLGLSRLRVPNVDGLSRLPALLAQLGRIKVTIDPAMATSIAALGTGLSKLKVPTGKQAQNIEGFFQSLGKANVKIDPALAASIGALGAGMAALKVPNGNAGRNMATFLSSLNLANIVKIDPALAAGLSALGSAMASVKVPGATAGARLNGFFSAFQGVVIDPAIATAMAGLGSAFAGFRAPTSNAAKNLKSMMDVLENGNPAKVGAMTAALAKLSGLQVKVASAGRGAKGGGGGGYGHATQGAQGLTHSLERLTSQFGLTYHAGTLLHELLGAFTLAEASRKILETGNAFVGLELSMNAVSSTATETAEHIAYIQKVSDDTGSNLQDNIGSYTKLAVAMRGAGYSAVQAQDAFKGFSIAFSVMHLSNADKMNAMRDIQEMFSMGVVHAQQLTRGLASHVPGVMESLAAAMSNKDKQTSVGDIEKQLKGGGLDPRELLKLAAFYENTFGLQLPAALQHSQTQMNIFANTWTKMREAIFSNGFDTGLAGMFSTLTAALNSAGIDNIGEAIGTAFKHAFTFVGQFGAILIANIKTVALFVGALAGLSAGLMALNIAASAANSIGTLTSALKSLVTGGISAVIGGFKGLGLAIQGIAAVARVGVGLIGLAFTLLPGIVSGVATLVVGALSILPAAAQGVAMLVSAAFAMLPVDIPLLAIAAGAALVAALGYAVYKASDMIGGWISETFPRMSSAIRSFKDWLFGDTSKDLTLSKSQGQQLGDAQGEGFVAGMWDTVKGSIASVGGKTMDYVKDMHVGDVLGGAMKSVGSSDMFKGLVSGLTEGVSKVSDMLGLSKLLAQVQNQIAEATGKTNDLQDSAAEAAARDAQLRANQLRDARALWQLEKGISDEQQKVVDKIDKAGKVTKDLVDDFEKLQSMLGRSSGTMEDPGAAYTQAQIDKLKAARAQETFKERDPLGAALQDYDAEIKGLTAVTDKQKIELEYQKKIQEFKTAQPLIDLSDDDLSRLHRAIELTHELKKGGEDAFDGWARAQKDFGKGLEDVTKKGLDGVADQLADFVVTGKADFRSLAQSLAKEMAQTAIKSMMAKSISGVEGMFGRSAEAKGNAFVAETEKGRVAKGLDPQAITTASEMHVKAGQVTINGGSGSNAAGGGSASTGAGTSSTGTAAVGTDLSASKALAAPPSAATFSPGAASGADGIAKAAAVAGGAATSVTNTLDGQFHGKLYMPSEYKSNGPAQFGNVPKFTDRADMDYLVSKGDTPTQASVELGNIKTESGLNPLALNPLDGTDKATGRQFSSYGLGQWNRGRAAEMQNFVEQDTGKKYQDLSPQELNFAQLDFYRQDVRKSGYANADKAGDKGWNDITSPQDAGSFGKRFEGYAGGVQQQRSNNAQALYDDYMKRHQADPNAAANATPMQKLSPTPPAADLSKAIKPATSPDVDTMPTGSIGRQPPAGALDPASLPPMPKMLTPAELEAKIDAQRSEMRLAAQANPSASTALAPPPSQLPGSAVAPAAAFTTDPAKNLMHNTPIVQGNLDGFARSPILNGPSATGQLAAAGITGGDVTGAFTPGSAGRAAMNDSLFDAAAVKQSQQDALKQTQYESDKRAWDRSSGSTPDQKAEGYAGTLNRTAFQQPQAPAFTAQGLQQKLDAASSTAGQKLSTSLGTASDQAGQKLNTSLGNATQQGTQSYKQSMDGASGEVAQKFKQDMQGAAPGQGQNQTGAGTSTGAPAAGGVPTAGGDPMSGISGMFGSMTSGLSGMLSGVMGKFSGIFSSLMGMLPKLLSGISSMFSGMGGGGGGGGMLGGLFGGGGGGMGGLGSLFGAFKEGGYSDSPVTHASASFGSFAGAPHYSEGTANTSGGRPAILHDNEAVIPLSRGREIPVKMTGKQDTNDNDLDSGPSHVTVVNINGVTDHDSFRRSQSQVAATMSASYMSAQLKS